jgi:hypothetical protein
MPSKLMQTIHIHRVSDEEGEGRRITGCFMKQSQTHKLFTIKSNEGVTIFGEHKMNKELGFHQCPYLVLINVY